MIRFSIFNFTQMNMDEITRIVGVPPSESYKKGDLIRKNLYRKENSWSYSTGYVCGWDVEVELEKMISILSPNIAKLSEYLIANDLISKFFIVLKFDSGTVPALVFPRNFIKIAARLNALIDTDMYVH